MTNLLPALLKTTILLLLDSPEGLCSSRTQIGDLAVVAGHVGWLLSEPCHPHKATGGSSGQYMGINVYHYNDFQDPSPAMSALPSEHEDHDLVPQIAHNLDPSPQRQRPVSKVLIYYRLALIFPGSFTDCRAISLPQDATAACC
jgi:hypothetical protein